MKVNSPYVCKERFGTTANVSQARYARRCCLTAGAADWTEVELGYGSRPVLVLVHFLARLMIACMHHLAVNVRNAVSDVKNIC